MKLRRERKRLFTMFIQPARLTKTATVPAHS